MLQLNRETGRHLFSTIRPSRRSQPYTILLSWGSMQYPVFRAKRLTLFRKTQGLTFDTSAIPRDTLTLLQTWLPNQAFLRDSRDT